MKLPHTIAMLVLLLLLGAYVFVFERKPIEDKKDEKQENIAEFDAAKLERLELNHAGKKLVLVQEGGKWKMVEPEASPVDVDKVSRNVDKIKDWKSLQTVMDNFKASDIKTFGLDEPYLTVYVKLKDENAPREYLIGNKTPTNSGYYVLLKGAPKLYVTYTYIPDDLAGLVREPPKPTPVPPPSPSPSK